MGWNVDRVPCGLRIFSGILSGSIRFVCTIVSGQTTYSKVQTEQPSAQLIDRRQLYLGIVLLLYELLANGVVGRNVRLTGHFNRSCLLIVALLFYMFTNNNNNGSWPVDRFVTITHRKGWLDYIYNHSSLRDQPCRHKSLNNGVQFVPNDTNVTYGLLYDYQYRIKSNWYDSFIYHRELSFRSSSKFCFLEKYFVSRICVNTATRRGFVHAKLMGCLKLIHVWVKKGHVAQFVPWIRGWSHIHVVEASRCRLELMIYLPRITM